MYGLHVAIRYGEVSLDQAIIATLRHITPLSDEMDAV